MQHDTEERRPFHGKLPIYCDVVKHSAPIYTKTGDVADDATATPTSNTVTNITWNDAAKDKDTPVWRPPVNEFGSRHMDVHKNQNENFHTAFPSTEFNTDNAKTNHSKVVELEQPRSRKRRTRTNYTKDQMERLERLFAASPYPSRDEYDDISRDLALDVHIVKVWFQNKRSRCRRTVKASMADYFASTKTLPPIGMAPLPRLHWPLLSTPTSATHRPMEPTARKLPAYTDNTQRSYDDTRYTKDYSTTRNFPFHFENPIPLFSVPDVSSVGEHENYVEQINELNSASRDSIKYEELVPRTISHSQNTNILTCQRTLTSFQKTPSAFQQNQFRFSPNLSTSNDDSTRRRLSNENLFLGTVAPLSNFQYKDAIPSEIAVPSRVPFNQLEDTRLANQYSQYIHMVDKHTQIHAHHASLQNSVSPANVMSQPHMVTCDSQGQGHCHFNHQFVAPNHGDSNMKTNRVIFSGNKAVLGDRDCHIITENMGTANTVDVSKNDNPSHHKSVDVDDGKIYCNTSDKFTPSAVKMQNSNDIYLNIKLNADESNKDRHNYVEMLTPPCAVSFDQWGCATSKVAGNNVPSANINPTPFCGVEPLTCNKSRPEKVDCGSNSSNSLQRNTALSGGSTFVDKNAWQCGKNVSTIKSLSKENVDEKIFPDIFSRQPNYSGSSVVLGDHSSNGKPVIRVHPVLTKPVSMGHS